MQWKKESRTCDGQEIWIDKAEGEARRDIQGIRSAQPAIANFGDWGRRPGLEGKNDPQQTTSKKMGILSNWILPTTLINMKVSSPPQLQISVQVGQHLISYFMNLKQRTSHAEKKNQFI